MDILEFIGGEDEDDIRLRERRESKVLGFVRREGIEDNAWKEGRMDGWISNIYPLFAAFEVLKKKLF